MHKQLLGEGCKIHVWDPYLSLGKLVGSNRQFIEEVIPHIGSLLGTTLREVVEGTEVVLVGTRAVQVEALAACLQTEQIVIDLVNLENARCLQGLAFYEGICW
jgi:GDP-mannose 6-dehydrogenase